jgi:hypothetical protein
MVNRDVPYEMLEEFISRFNQYEVERGLFAMRDRQGYPWWDLVRYRVQFTLCIERDFFGNKKFATPPSILIRAQSFARQLRRLLRDITRLRGHKIRQVRTLIVSKRPLNYINNVIFLEAEHGNVVLLVNKTGDAATPHIAITRQSMEFFTRLTQRTQRLPPEVEQEARRLANDIRERFESRMNIFGIIATKYREEMIARHLWSFMLDRASTVEKVVFVNDDTVKSLVFVARSRGLDTEEVQHAYMGKAHIAFSYPPLDSILATMPDRAIITRDTGDITYPVERVIVNAGSKRRGVIPRDIDILIGSSPARHNETAAVLTALAGHGFRLAVKLHPAEAYESSEASARFSNYVVTIHYGDEDFCALVARARLFIPINLTSTTAFEAAEMGARVVLVHFGGVKKTAVSDAAASAHVYCLDDLLDAVEAQLAEPERETCLDAGNRK